MNNSSVGDLASQIMAGKDPIAQPAPAGLPENSTDPLIVETQSSLDISDVEVPTSFMDQILGTPTPDKGITTTSNKMELIESTTTATLVVDEDLKDFIKEEDAQEVDDLFQLVNEVKALLLEVKGVLTEMTTVGAIGVNMGAGPGKKKKGDEVTEPVKKEKTSMEQLLKKIKARKRKTT